MIPLQSDITTTVVSSQVFSRQICSYFADKINRVMPEMQTNAINLANV